MSDLSDLLHQIPVIGRMILILGILLQIVILTQMVSKMFDSMRSWKFTATFILGGVVLTWLCIHLYSVAYVGISPEPQPCTAAATASPTPSPEPSR